MDAVVLVVIWSQIIGDQVVIWSQVFVDPVKLSTVSPLYLQVPHAGIQPSPDRKYKKEKKKNPENFQEAKL